MTKDNFLELMQKLLDIYPSFRIGEGSVQAIWWEKFESLRYDYARIAIKKYTDTEKFAPTPADIITRYREVEAHNKKLLKELKDIFNIARQYYPSPLWRDTDEKAFMTKIKSNTFKECRIKAERILKATKNNEETDRTFTEFIEGLEC